MENFGSTDSSIGKEKGSQKSEDGVGTSQTPIYCQVKRDVVFTVCQVCPMASVLRCQAQQVISKRRSERKKVDQTNFLKGILSFLFFFFFFQYFFVPCRKFRSPHLGNISSMKNVDGEKKGSGGGTKIKDIMRGKCIKHKRGHNK